MRKILIFNVLRVKNFKSKSITFVQYALVEFTQTIFVRFYISAKRGTNLPVK